MTRQILAIIGGDGIDPEVTTEALKVLRAAVSENASEEVHSDLGAERWLRTGEVPPDSMLEDLRTTDAILLGAVGAVPGSDRIPSGLLERGLLLRLRFAFDHAANLRSSRLYAGVSTPLSPEVVVRGNIDSVVMREGIEGPYCDNGGTARAGTPREIAIEVSVDTTFGVGRAARDAFARTRARRGRITLLHKHNVLVSAGGLWRRLFDRVGGEFPDAERDYLRIDAAIIVMMVDPAQSDVIIADNLLGDIVTDLATVVTGDIGLTTSANINPSDEYPSMFRPVHDSALDIAGRGIADPTAATSFTALSLTYLGYPKAAHRVDDAATADITGYHPGPVRTSEIGD